MVERQKPEIKVRWGILILINGKNDRGYTTK